MFYAGIGSRKTPETVCSFMTTAASILEQKGYVLRSGGAVGADRAFEYGVVNNKYKEIFLPFSVCEFALHIASSIHPKWDALSDYSKKLHARNIYQILGGSLDTPVDFVICWTPEGKHIGGTRTALVLAQQYNIPIFNLAIEKDFNEVLKILF